MNKERFFTLSNKQVPLWVCLASLIIGTVFGAWTMYSLGPKQTEHHYTEKTIVEKPTIVQGEIREVTGTQVVYVPKEVVSYENPVTGQRTEDKEATDVQIDIKQPIVHVKLNDKEYPFTLNQQEDQKFENGKLVLTQTGQINFDAKIEPQIVDNTKKGSIDIIIGKYSGIGIQHDRFGLDFTTNIRDKNDYQVQARWKAIQWK